MLRSSFILPSLAAALLLLLSQSADAVHACCESCDNYPKEYCKKCTTIPDNKVCADADLVPADCIFSDDDLQCGPANAPPASSLKGKVVLLKIWGS